MNKKIIGPAVGGVILAIIGIIFLFPIENPEPETFSVSYTETNKNIQIFLAGHDISMSSPLRLNGFSIEEYCTFFSDEAIQNSITYCTSTELLDSKGQYLGNIHMVGAPSEPWYLIGVIQTDPFVSQLDDIKTIYRTMIESTVCKCWDEKKPGGFDSVSSWVDAASNHHLDAKKTTSKSSINGLEQKDLLLEITTNTEGYLWKFIIPV